MMTNTERARLRELAGRATPGPWCAEKRDWRGNESPHDFYVSGDFHDDYDDETESAVAQIRGTTATAVCIVKGNATAGDIPEHNARLLVMAVNSAMRLCDTVDRLVECLRPLAEAWPMIGDARAIAAARLLAELEGRS